MNDENNIPVPQVKTSSSLIDAMGHFIKTDVRGNRQKTMDTQIAAASKMLQASNFAHKPAVQDDIDIVLNKSDYQDQLSEVAEKLSGCKNSPHKRKSLNSMSSDEALADVSNFKAAEETEASHGNSEPEQSFTDFTKQPFTADVESLEQLQIRADKVYKQTGNMQEKINVFQRALQDGQPKAEILAQLAICIRDTDTPNKYDEMEIIAREAIEQNFKCIEAHLALGEVQIELGKGQAESNDMIKQGIASLQLAYELCLQQKVSEQKAIDVLAELRRAQKLEFLKQHAMDSENNQTVIKDVKTKLGTLNKLMIVFKVNKGQRPNTKLLTSDMKSMCESEHIVPLKKMYVPEHLICQIKGDLMEDPVIIESGRTFEREEIVKYFERQSELQKKQDDQGEDSDAEKCNFLRCPISLQPVDPSIMIPNKQIKEATRQFLDQNPWAFEFDPRQKFSQLSIWERKY